MSVRQTQNTGRDVHRGGLRNPPWRPRRLAGLFAAAGQSAAWPAAAGATPIRRRPASATSALGRPGCGRHRPEAQRKCAEGADRHHRRDAARRWSGRASSASEDLGDARSVAALWRRRHRRRERHHHARPGQPEHDAGRQFAGRLQCRRRLSAAHDGDRSGVLRRRPRSKCCADRRARCTAATRSAARSTSSPTSRPTPSRAGVDAMFGDYSARIFRGFVSGPLRPSGGFDVEGRLTAVIGGPRRPIQPEPLHRADGDAQRGRPGLLDGPRPAEDRLLAQAQPLLLASISQGRDPAATNTAWWETPARFIERRRMAFR